MKDTHTPPSSVRIPKDLKAKAQDKAAGEGRTLTDVIVEALERYVRDELFMPRPSSA